MFAKKKQATSNKFNPTQGRRKGSVATAVVPMKRWVHRNQIEVGMYVNELDKPWEDTRFLFQGFVIDSRETLQQVQEACEYANVQTEKLSLISTKGSGRMVAATR